MILSTAPTKEAPTTENDVTVKCRPILIRISAPIVRSLGQCIVSYHAVVTCEIKLFERFISAFVDVRLK